MSKSLNFLFVVPAYDSSVAIASRELIAKSNQIRGDIYTGADILKKGINLQPYDIILHYCWMDSDITGYLEKYRDNTVICICQGNAMEADNFKVFQINCKTFKFVGCCNWALYNFYIARTDKKVFYLSHGVDTDLFKPSNRPHNKFTIGWVGPRDSKIKNYEMVKTIWAQHCEGCNLLYAENLPHEKMPSEFYEKIDLLLVVSKFEAHPLPVYEAMSSGIPIVALDVGDISENVIDGINGFILPRVADVTEISNKVKYLKDHPEVCSLMMGKANRQKVLQTMYWSRVCWTYENLGGIVHKNVVTTPEKPDILSASKYWDDTVPKWSQDLRHVDEMFDRNWPYYKYLLRTKPRSEAINGIFNFMLHMDAPKISVVISTRDRAWCIGNALDSLLAEGYPNLEILVVDSNSKGMEEVKAKYKDRVQFYDVPLTAAINDGGYKANIALDKATGDYIAWLADDDLHEDGAYTLLALAAVKGGDYAVFGNYKTFYSDSGATVDSKFTGLADFNTLLRGNYVGGLALLHRNNKEIRMDPNDSYGDDWDRWLYISAKYGLHHVPVMCGTVIINPTANRMGERAAKDGSMSERFAYHRKVAMEKHSLLRKDNPDDMHVALFSYSYGIRPFGGSANNHWNVMDSLTSQGIDVVMVTDKPENVYYKNHEKPHKVVSTKDFFDSKMYEKYNVFHVFAGTHYPQKLNEVGIKPICGSNIVTNCGLKELVPYADAYVNTPEKWEAIRQGDIKNLNSCNAMFWVAQSKFQAWCYEKLCNYKGDTFLFPNTIDCEDKYTFMPMSERPKKVLWTGSRAVGKGWKQFDDVAKLLPEVEFIALSETEIPFTAKNIKPIFGSGMDLMPDLYKLGCMIVTTSLCENQPLGVIEAYATGLPCVAFDALDTPHGISEVVKNGKTGYLTKFGDPKDMAKAIDKLLKDDELRAGMGVTAREWAVSHFDYRHTLRTMLNVYAEYLNRRMT